MKYLDISQWQTNVEYKRASEGLDGIILRAGYGKGNEDTMFRKHYEGFSNQGVPIGAYWFSYATNVEEAINEARYCVAAIHGLKIELPVCFDFEDDSVEYAKSHGVKITKQLATRMADAFLNTLELNGYYAMLYANPNYLKNYYGNLSRYDLWLAHWFANPDLTSPPQVCGIWQHGTGVWDGFTGDVDLDESYKNYPEIIRKAKLNHLPPPDPLWLTWAVANGLLTKEQQLASVTKGDVARMLYEYHHIFSREDNKQLSGILGG